jgi:hypothetical protein
MTAEKWGKEIIGITWHFVLECWYSRNLTEHDTLNNPTLRAKEKLTEKIMWIIGNLPSTIQHPYVHSTVLELTMTLNNFSSLLRQAQINENLN